MEAVVAECLRWHRWTGIAIDSSSLLVLAEIADEIVARDEWIEVEKWRGH